MTQDTKDKLKKAGKIALGVASGAALAGGITAAALKGSELGSLTNAAEKSLADAKIATGVGTGSAAIEAGGLHYTVKNGKRDYENEKKIKNQLEALKKKYGKKHTGRAAPAHTPASTPAPASAQEHR